MSAIVPPDLIVQADSFLDSEKHHKDASELGKFLHREFDADREGRISSQVRNLQQMAVSATRLADVEDFVKTQMGRKAGAYKQWRRVGDETLRQLGILRQAADGFTADEGQRLLLRLHLVRGWVRAVVGAYLYEKAEKEMQESHA
jgi:hypothetical protein